MRLSTGVFRAQPRATVVRVAREGGILPSIGRARERGRSSRSVVACSIFPVVVVCVNHFWVPGERERKYVLLLRDVMRVVLEMQWDKKFTKSWQL